MICLNARIEVKKVDGSDFSKEEKDNVAENLDTFLCGASACFKNVLQRKGELEDYRFRTTTPTFAFKKESEGEVIFFQSRIELEKASANIESYSDAFSYEELETIFNNIEAQTAQGLNSRLKKMQIEEISVRITPPDDYDHYAFVDLISKSLPTLRTK